MARLTKKQAYEDAARKADEAATYLRAGNARAGHGFLEAAVAQAAALMATPITVRKVAAINVSDPGLSSSLEKGLAILGQFSSDTILLSVSYIAAHLGLPRSTTHRYLTTLVKHGYLEQPAGASRRYRRTANVD